MPARVQQLVLGLGANKQTAIGSAGSTFLRFKKLDTTIATPKPVFENDAAEIGMPPQHGRGPHPLIAETLRRRREELAKQPKDLPCAAGGVGTATDIGK